MYVETLLRCMGRGWLAALRAPGVVLACWLANVAAAAAFTYVLWSSMNDHFGRSVLLEEFRDSLSIGLLLDWLAQDGGAIVGELRGFLWVAVLYLAAMAYLSPGFMRAAAERRRFSFREFHATGRANLIPFAIFAAATGVLGYILYTYPKRLLDAGGDWLGHAATVAWPVFWYQLFVWGIVALILSYVLRVFDYARTARILWPKMGLLRAFWFGVATPFRRFFTTLALWLVPAAMVYAILYALSGYYTLNGGAELNATLWTFGATQLAIAVRVFGSCARLGSAVAYAQALAIESESHDTQAEPNALPVDTDTQTLEEEEHHEELNVPV